MEILLMLAGAVAVYMCMAGLYRRIWTKGLEADVYFSSDTAVSGDSVELIEVITNRKWMPVPFVNVKFMLDRGLHFDGADSNSNVTDNSYKNDVFSLLFHQRITRRVPIICRRRGVYCIDYIELISKGLFMDEIMSCKKKMHREITVYPMVADTQRIEVPYRAIMGDILTRRNIYEDPFEFRGIRDYEPYDTLKSVNWKATARTGELKVNLYDYTASQSVCILLNLEQEGMLCHEALMEESISIAAGLMQRIIRAGVNVSLISNGRDGVTGENLHFAKACTDMHINAVNTGLARINLKLEMQPLTDFINDVDSDSLYILISSGKSSMLQSKYDRMCAEGRASMWILPYHPGMDTGLKNCPHASVMAWEVMLP